MEKQLNLPQTDFPQKANSLEREPDFNLFWKENEVFKKRNQLNNEEFLLHDGPPYANGNPHMGHTLNKLLKDVVVRYQLMNGKKVDFKPGWDCHGLPTELKVQKEYGKLPTGELREKCAETAEYWMQQQKSFFERLGLFGDWDNPYLTMSKDYEVKQLKAFANLFFDGWVYRDNKPVHYSPATKTVLAEAELEYFDKTDLSVYVKFPAKDFNLLVWTTQPWTLLGNMAVCVNPNLDYVVCDGMLVAESRMSAFGFTEYTAKYKGSELELMSYDNLNDFGCRVLLDNFVTADSGTGLVHLCPSHGDDDFRVCQNYDIRKFVTLDVEKVEELNFEVLDTLTQNNMLYKTEKVVHSYPHDWRTKTPVYFLLTEQFFLSMPDRVTLLKAADKVDFSKSTFKNRFKSMVDSRSSWCLSRQRKWGFPIPLFLDKKKKVFLDETMLAHLVSLFEVHGSNCWFTMTETELLPEKYHYLNLKKVEDTMDVWLDSGLSWNNAINGKQADLYFEGSDQHRGWFQSSFLTSMMLNGAPPYKKVLTHGFVLDQDGRKMSKSEGNVVDPRELLNKYNADVLRLWALSVDYTIDFCVGEKTMDSMANVYFKLRNNFRYLLSNLFDYDYSYQPEEMCDKDNKALKELEKFEHKMKDSYSTYDFRNLFNLTTAYVSTTSKWYFDLETKGLLYEGEPDRKERKDRQYVISKILDSLVRLLAPMTPYLCEDVYSFMPNKSELSVFMLEI
jgi:isoleucyl-tRNA synthetase